MSGSSNPIDDKPYQYLAVLTQQAVLSDGAKKHLFALWGLTEAVNINFYEELFDQDKLDPIEPPFFEAYFCSDNIRHVINEVDTMLNRMKNYDYQLDVFELGREISNIIPVTIRRQWHLG